MQNACTELSSEFTDNIFDKYGNYDTCIVIASNLLTMLIETAISNATKDAVHIASKWGAPVK